MVSSITVDWAKYRRVGSKRVSEFLPSDESKATALEDAIYRYSVGRSSTGGRDGTIAEEAGTKYKELIRTLGKFRDESEGPSPKLLEARDNYAAGSLSLVGLLQEITGDSNTLQVLKAGGYKPDTSAPLPVTPAAPTAPSPPAAKAREEGPVITIEGEPEEPQIAIPDPVGADVVEQFNDVKQLLTLIQRLKPETFANLKRKAEDRRGQIDPIYQKEKRLKEDERRLAEKKSSYAECDKELREKEEENRTFEARAEAQREADEAQHLQEMRDLDQRYEEIRVEVSRVWDEESRLKKEVAQVEAQLREEAAKNPERAAKLGIKV